MLLLCFWKFCASPTSVREGIPQSGPCRLKPADGWLTAILAPPLGLPNTEVARPQHGHIK